VFVIFKLVEAGAGGREQHDIAGLRGAEATSTARWSVPARSMATLPAIWLFRFSALRAD